MTPSLAPGLYAILDHGTYDDLFRLGRELLGLDLCALQVRAKSLSPVERARLTEELLAEHQRVSAPFPFLVNDDVALASRLGCGLHLGQTDLPLEEARSTLGPNAFIGLSTHSLSHVRQGLSTSASYLAYGPLYSTHSKVDAHSPRGTDDLKRIVSICSRPLVVIGGLTFEKAISLLPQGIRHFAMISALHEPNLSVRWRQFHQAMQHHP